MDKYEITNLTRSDFDNFFEIMKDSFPSEERRNADNALKVFDNDLYNVVGLKNESGLIIGFISFWAFERFNYIEHFAVDKIFRGNGIGRYLINEYLNKCDKVTVLEVELPENTVAEKRISFYESIGFIVNDYKYVQPPYEDDKDSVELKIMSYGKKLVQDEFISIRDKLYKDVYRIKE